MFSDQINFVPLEMLHTILQTLGIDVREFMYNLQNDNPKEIMIYAKIYALYMDTAKIV
jgi:hypothetical protein